MHVTPGITSASLVSTGKYADADYATIYLKDRVEVFDLENTIFLFPKRQFFAATDAETACTGSCCGPQTQRP